MFYPIRLLYLGILWLSKHPLFTLFSINGGLAFHQNNNLCLCRTRIFITFVCSFLHNECTTKFITFRMICGNYVDLHTIWYVSIILCSILLTCIQTYHTLKSIHPLNTAFSNISDCSIGDTCWVQTVEGDIFQS